MIRELAERRILRKRMLTNYNGEILKNPYKSPLNIHQHLALNKITALRNLIIEGRPITQTHQSEILSLVSRATTSY